MTADPRMLSDACHLLGGLLLEGADRAMLAQVRETGAARALGEALGGPLGGALEALHGELGGDLDAVALEFTRLMIADGTAGARARIPVRPWEDCYCGPGDVMGQRRLAVLRAYVAAALGFDEMKTQPADHIGLELCFVSALLQDEAKGERDDAARAAFTREHLDGFARKIGGELVAKSRHGAWRAVGTALTALPASLGSRALPVVHEPGVRA